ncbi:MAG TPA: divergent polysaccharide deacetylase family protein, partial [Xanthobacteraceae bacterium]
MTDDLSAPLGQSKSDAGKHLKKRIAAALPLVALWAAAGLLGCFTLGFLGWSLLTEAPLGGEPTAVASINPHADAVGADAKPGEAGPRRGDGGDPDHPNRYDGPSTMAGQGAAVAPGNTVTIIDGTNGKRQDFVVPGRQGAAGAGAAEARFAEPSRSGPIPRIAQDGTRPAEAFAQPVRGIPDRPNAPRVAIVVAGLGISAIGTSDALAKLPGPVTFAFAPYGADLEHLATRAREGGHELLLQVPMEPFDYPDNDPGPQTLLTSLTADQNIDRLHWFMSRFQGYVGITNYMGGRFTATEPTLGPVIREATKRGLIYFDDATSPRSLAGQIAGGSNAAFARA